MKMGLQIACVTLLLGGIVSTVEAQNVVVPNGQQFSIVSSGTQRQYKIFVHEPSEPPSSSAGYPVVYFLDGNDTFLIAAGISRVQATHENGLEPALVVAVGYEGEQLLTSEARYLDLTPRPDPDGVPARITAEGLTKFGGADAFFKFLQTDLKPAIQQRFRIDLTRQTLFGHSLGGLFVLHTLLKHPDSFSTYIAGSSAIWWNKKAILRDAQEFIDGTAREIPRARILIGVGAKEPKTIIDGSRAMADTLRRAPHLEVCLVNLPHEDHISAMSVMISRAVSFALSKDSCPDM